MMISKTLSFATLEAQNECQDLVRLCYGLFFFFSRNDDRPTESEFELTIPNIARSTVLSIPPAPSVVEALTAE